MNALLFGSSVVVSFFLFLIYWFYYNPHLQLLYFTTVLGSFTSILNHGVSNSDFKYYDRFTIVLSAIVYLYYIFALDTVRMITSLFVITFAGLMYFYAKLKETPICHLVAHFLLVPLFLIIHLKNKRSLTLVDVWKKAG